MNKKIFAISDLHGHYSLTIKSLKDAGWDENNENHLLIVCGDCFDRFEENLIIFEWLYRLTKENKAIVLRGNHDSMLINYLDGTSISPFNYTQNGTCETIDDFLGRTRSFESWCLIDKKCEPTIGAFATFIKESREEINNEYPNLLPWLKSLPWYYETDNYIFTHASIDNTALDWHYPHCILYDKVDWEALTWDDGSFINKKINNTNKTIVIGHYSTEKLRKIYNINNNVENKHSILKYDNKIFLDACTILSKQVNVLVIEDNLLKEEE